MSKRDAQINRLEDRRMADDRRGKSNFALHGKRAHARRSEEAVNNYVDRYSARWFVLMISIILLCCADAILCQHRCLC